MNIDFKSLDKEGIEIPDDFSFEREMELVRKFLDALVPELGVSTIIHKNVQDATYFCQIDCTFEMNKGREVIYCTFSNFGRMVLVWGDRDVIVRRRSQLEKIVSLLARYGFIPLEKKDVSGFYNGVHEEWVNKRWLDRFFAHY